MTGYGTQTQTTWAAGEVDDRPIADASRTPHLWRISVTGENVTLSMSYGTKGSVRLVGIRLPFLAYVPGNFSLNAVPLVPGAAARAVPTLTEVLGGGGAIVRTVEAGALDARVHRVTALGAATVTVAGNAVVLASGDTLDTVEASVVTAGTVLADWII